MNLFELANALSMIAPMFTWLRHRRHRSHQQTHKLMALQIPISFFYHMSVSILGQCHLSRLLRACDITLIHIYSFVATRTVKRKTILHVNDTDKTFEDMLLVWNTYYIFRVCQGHDDSLVRIIGIYASSVYAVFGKKETVMLTGIGSLCSLLYIFDNRLNNMGHSLFHIALGGLYDCVLRLE